MGRLMDSAMSKGHWLAPPAFCFKPAGKVRLPDARITWIDSKLAPRFGDHDFKSTFPINIREHTATPDAPFTLRFPGPGWRNR